MEPEQAKNEARSKIMWGDDPTQVATFLRTQGFTAEEAQAIIGPIVKERAQAVRKTGMNKIFVGVGMMLIPVVALVIFLSVGYIPMKIFGLLVAIGVWGAFRVLNGVIMVLSPKSEKGDVSEM